MKARPLYAAQATIASPLGPVLLARTALGLAGVWFDGQKDHPGRIDAPQAPGDELLREAATQLHDYWAGSRQRFNLPLDLHGTPFQLSVWRALLGVDAGSTLTYGEIAQRIGAPQAVRAVGAAVGRNPISVVVPCHRIIGRDGSLTGYAGGLHRKTALLKLEGVLA